MDLKYIELLKEWVRLDNIVQRNNVDVKAAKDKVKEVEDKVSETVEQKKQLEGDICTYVQSNKLESMQLKISDGVITFGKKTSQKPLSQKFLREVMQQYSDDHPEENIPHEKMLEFILSRIEKKTTYEINRVVSQP